MMTLYNNLKTATKRRTLTLTHQRNSYNISYTQSRLCDSKAVTPPAELQLAPRDD